MVVFPAKNRVDTIKRRLKKSPIPSGTLLYHDKVHLSIPFFKVFCIFQSFSIHVRTTAPTKTKAARNSQILFTNEGNCDRIDL
jgi:hypothetical protein